MEEKEILGHWWIPGNDISMPGILTIEGKKIRLKIIGALGDNSLSLEVPILNGFSENGKKITLYNNFRYNFMSRIPGIKSELYYINYVLIGHHFLKSSDLKFKRISIEYAFMNSWLNDKGLNLINKEGKIEIDTNTSKYFVEAFDKFRISLEIFFNWKINNFENSYKVSQKSIFRITFRRIAKFENLIQYHLYLQDLLMLLTNKPTVPKSMTLRTKDWKRNDSIKVQLIYGYDFDFEIKENITPDAFLIPSQLFEKEYNVIIRNWFNRKNQIELASEKFFSSLYAPLFIVDKFLVSIRTLESLHRELINNGNVNQRVRYDYVIQTYRNMVRPVVKLSSKNEWLNRVVEYRNKLTHNNRIIKSQYVLNKDMRLKYLEIGIFIHAFLLDQTGIERKHIKTNIINFFGKFG
jgi:hypothetical protein